MVDRYAGRQSAFAVRFFFSTVALLAAGFLLAEVLIRLVGFARVDGAVRLPPAFIISSVCLAAGSWFLQIAWGEVSRERQRAFRRSLLKALLAGTLFVALQTFGLWCLAQNRGPEDAADRANSFVFVLAAMHGLHFSVALMFLICVSLRAFADRYDHEYYAGVMFCACFWHFLGVVWLAILFVLFITSSIH